MKYFLSLVKFLESYAPKKPRSLLTSSPSLIYSNHNCNQNFHFQRKITYFNNPLLAKNAKMGCSTSKVEVSHSTSLKTQDPASPTAEDEYVEGVVCKTTDINDNEMKTFELGDAGKVLLVKQNGAISAIGTKCTHYGAPLVSGALGDGRVRCQWHGACFNILNGDIEDFPGLDSLPCYQVTIQDNEVKVRAKRSHLSSNKRTPAMTAKSPKEDQHIVVIGGGPSGATCVETLRQEGFSGAITLVCREDALPYDRVKVSKVMDFELEKAQFRSEDFYKENGIEVLKNTAATGVKTSEHSVTLSTGKTLKYDKLYIATGVRADKAPVPGADLENVVVLRDYAHSVKTNALLSPEKEVVVLGSSFVAMESANYCLNKVKKVTLIGRGNVPFKALVGERVGAAYMKLFQDKGVNFIMHSGITRCIEDPNNPGHASQVELIDGTILKADIVIMGVGGSCYTEFLADSGIELRKDGTIEVNEFLQTGVEDVYVGGDIAHAPVWSHGGLKSTIAHYPLAHYHGKVAALNMLGKRTELKAVPYFWTMVFGKGLRYSGHGKYTDIVHVGNVEELKFVAFYLDGEEVVAASSTGMDPVVSQFAELLAQGKKLTRGDVEGDEKFTWTRKLYEK